MTLSDLSKEDRKEIHMIIMAHLLQFRKMGTDNIEIKVFENYIDEILLKNNKKLTKEKIAILIANTTLSDYFDYLKKMAIIEAKSVTMDDFEDLLGGM